MDQRRWNQIEELLQKALDLASGERPGFLETACVGDAELRSVVETLLKREEQARSFIETPAIAYGAFVSDATDCSFGPHYIGDRIRGHAVLQSNDETA